MFCPNCGKSLPDGAKYCSGCGIQLQASAAKPKKEKFTGKRRVWPILLAVVLIAGAIGGFLAYRHYVVKPREAVDDLIRCLKQSDAYESAGDFRLRLSDYDYDYSSVIYTDYGKGEIEDYFSNLYRDENYAEYIHDASVLQHSFDVDPYTIGYFTTASALERLWEMGSATSIIPDDFDLFIGVLYFRDVQIEDYYNVQDRYNYMAGRDDPEECYGVTSGRMFSSFFIWPVLSAGEYHSFIVIDTVNGNYLYEAD